MSMFLTGSYTGRYRDIDYTHTPIVLPKRYPEPFSEERAAIDKERARLANEERQLNSLRNEYSSICRLPPEILSYIFLLHSQNVTEHQRHLTQPHSPYYSHARLVWVPVTHVCRHFRSVALGCPTLWTYLDFPSRAWTHEMLSRSKGAELTLNVTRPTMADLVEIALRQLHRIKEIRLTTISIPGLKRLLRGLDSEAPKLETLTIAPIGSEMYSSPHERDSVLPPELFTGGTPHLKHLQLINCHMTWRKEIPTMLTAQLSSLVLTEYHHDGFDLPTLSQLLDVMENMPGLQKLQLSNTLPAVPEDVNDVHLSDRVVSLPKLNSLSVSGPIMGCTVFLHSLDLPGSPKLIIMGRSASEAVAETTALSRALSRCRSSAPAPQGLFMDSLIGVSVHLYLWDKVSGKSLPSIEKCSVELRITKLSEEALTLNPTRSRDIFNAILNNLQLKQLRILDATESVGLNEEMWRSYFGSLPSLWRVQAVGMGARGLVQALMPTVTTGTPFEIHSHLLFPALTSIRLDRVNFEVVDVLGFQMGMDINLLRETLQLRAEYGVEIQEMALRYSQRVQLEYIDELSRLVPKLDWDGCGLGDTSDEDEDHYSSDTDMYFYGAGGYIDVGPEDYEEDAYDTFPFF